MSDVLAVLLAISVFILSIDDDAPDISIFDVDFLNMFLSLESNDSDLCTDFEIVSVMSDMFFSMFLESLDPELTLVNACFKRSRDFIVSVALSVKALLSRVTLAIFSSTTAMLSPIWYFCIYVDNFHQTF